MKLSSAFLLLFLSGLFIAPQVFANKIYKWTDKDGNIHFSDKARDAKAVEVDIKPMNRADTYAVQADGAVSGTDLNKTNNEKLKKDDCDFIRNEMNKVMNDGYTASVSKKFIAEYKKTLEQKGC